MVINLYLKTVELISFSLIKTFRLEIWFYIKSKEDSKISLTTLFMRILK